MKLTCGVLTTTVLLGALLSGYLVSGRPGSSSHERNEQKTDVHNTRVHRDAQPGAKTDSKFIAAENHDDDHDPHHRHLYHKHDQHYHSDAPRHNPDSSRYMHDASTQTSESENESETNDRLPRVRENESKSYGNRLQDDSFIDTEDFEPSVLNKHSTNPLYLTQTNKSGSRYQNLMIISTLDGKLSALDADRDGALVWSINVGGKPLLSSSISNLEVIRDGLVSRLIPSLDGSLYQFNGDDMERLPFNADTLLSSSSRLTEDTMVVGSRDIAIFGVDPYTGQVKYICGSDGCGHSRDSEKTTEDIITIRRKSHTLRAIHITSGEEKWNFSVGQHDLEFIDKDTSDQEDSFFESQHIPVKVYVPDGVVVATSEGDLEEEVWRHQFSTPITRAWKLSDGNLEEISMFDCRYVPTLTDEQRVLASQPMLFFGQHRGQLYIQPSVSGTEAPQAAIDEFLKLHVNGGTALERRIPKIKWKPYLATASSRTPHLQNMVKLLDYDHKGQKRTSKERESTDEPYPYDSGYYLIPDITYLPEHFPELEDHSEHRQILENDTDYYYYYINESIWVWWKEIIAISLCTSLVVQLLMNVFKTHKTEIVNPDSSRNERTISESSRSDETEYQNGTVFTSRFHSDFDVIETLGRGGFGVVFRAKNKMDELEYAVKRICVKNTPESREKVLREARAMAKLEHVGIIRYYQVFVETPPLGWQRLKDLELFGPDVTLSSPMVTETPATTPDIEVKSLVPGFVAKKFTNPLQISDDDTGANSASLGGGDRPYPEDDSLEVVFEHSQSQSTGEVSVPFSRYLEADDSMKCDSVGCSDVSTHKGDGDVQWDSGSGSSISGSKNIPTTSGSFSVKGAEADDILSVREKPPKLYLYIQMQLCERATLKDWLTSNTLKRDCTLMLDYFSQIVHAVAYVHDCSMIHRDLKPSNIFFSVHDNNIIKIGDFGLVTAHEEESQGIYDDVQGRDDMYQSHTNQVGTQLYMSPEQINGLPYGQKVDIFSLGLIFLEFFYPCSTQMERITVLSDAKKQILPERFQRELKEESKFVKWLCSEDPGERPSCAEMLDSDLLKDVVPSSTTHRRSNSQSILKKRNVVSS